jgi:hypothetical protein
MEEREMGDENQKEKHDEKQRRSTDGEMKTKRETR